MYSLFFGMFNRGPFMRNYECFLSGIILWATVQYHATLVAGSRLHSPFLVEETSVRFKYDALHLEDMQAGKAISRKLIILMHNIFPS
jgi:hypothetical protein